MILPPEDQTNPNRDYCLLCGADRIGPAPREGVPPSIKNIEAHVSAQHGENPEEGVNWASGWQVGVMRERLEAQIRRFALNLDSCRGVEDFLLEAGDA